MSNRFSAAEVSGPGRGVHNEAVDRVAEHFAGRPDEMHVHSLRDRNIPIWPGLANASTSTSLLFSLATA